MSITKRHKELFLYPAGLISLILLPALCIGFLYKHKSFETITAIELNWWNKELNNLTIEKYNFKIHPDRSYIDFILTGDDNSDRIKLDTAQLKIKQLIASEDTTKGVHFQFNDQAKYWTLVTALDICNIENVKRYVPYDNDIWIFNLPSKPEIEPAEKEEIIFCGNSSMVNIEIFPKSFEQIYNERHEKINFIIDTAKKFWLSEVLYIAMIMLTITKLRRGPRQ